MEVEIDFLHRTLAKKGPKLLMDHIQSMGSAEFTFYATTLSLVYDRLVQKVLQTHISFGTGAGDPPGGVQSITASSSTQASTTAPNVTLSPIKIISITRHSDLAPPTRGG
jgi:hypothetical protein